MAKILVVDDEPGFLAGLYEGLSQMGHKVTSAENGKIGRDLVAMTDFDLVISDFQMPFLDGVELLKWIKQNKPKIKVTLMTGFSHILETKQAFDLGADDFLTKPIQLHDLRDSVVRVLAPPQGADKPMVKSTDDEYCKLPIEDFISNSKVNIALFVRLSSSKYVRVAHLGDQLEGNRVETYRQKGLTYLYCKKADFAKVVDFNLDLLRKLDKTGKISREKKTAFLRYTTETVLENCAVQGMNKETFDQAKDCVGRTLSLVTESDDAFNLLSMLNEHADWIYAHSIGVSIYAVMIAKKLGWESQATLFKLSTAGLFHDIGKKEIDSAVLNKSRGLLVQEERSLYETHPRRGRDIVLALKEMPGDLIQIIHEHHEDFVGQGYPNRISRDKIHPLAKVIAIADQFCYYAIKNPHSLGCAGPEAIQRMAEMYGESLHPVPYKALVELKDNLD